MRAIFKVEYSGEGAKGIGALAFVDGKVAGFDFAGAEFHGRYDSRDQALVGRLSQATQDGGVPNDLPFEINSEATDQTIDLAMPVGVITIRLIKMGCL